MSVNESDSLIQIIERIGKAIGADIYVYNAEINSEYADELIHAGQLNQRKADQAALILTTDGGDPNSAYRIMRYLQRNYKKVIAYIFGRCKSAGTIAVLGADEVVMSDYGELGPLDVQLAKKEEIFTRTSGEDINQAITNIAGQATSMVNTLFYNMYLEGGGFLSTKTASEVASRVTADLLSPITSQISPLRIGEISRANKIGVQYGYRLCNRDKDVTQKQKDAIFRLTSHYPSHSFVIDIDEAKTLLDNVRGPEDVESELSQALAGMMRSQASDDSIVALFAYEKGGMQDDGSSGSSKSGRINSSVEGADARVTTTEQDT